MSGPTTEAGKRLVNHILLFDIVDRSRLWAEREVAEAEAEARTLDVDRLAQTLADMDIWNTVRDHETTDTLAAAIARAYAEADR